MEFPNYVLNELRADITQDYPGNAVPLGQRRAT
jgi:hypothetical protein